MRFQKRIQVLPWVWLNISKSGFSLSFGPPGLSINLGKKGTRVTAGLPGTGLSSSHLFPKNGEAPKAGNVARDFALIDPALLPHNGSEVDPLYIEAVSFVVSTRRPSVSAIQRQLRLGYARASSMIEQMQVDGIVSSLAPDGGREVLWVGISDLNLPEAPQNEALNGDHLLRMATDDGYSVDPEIAKIYADRTVTTEQIDQAVDDAAYASWLENFLDEENLAADPLYSRAVAYALTRQHIHPVRLAYELWIMPERAEFLVRLMALEGIRKEGPDSYAVVSPFDADELRKDFERYRSYS
ncbi:DUF4236 domain-containing protein [Pseudomonas sp. LF242]